jgi:hypothetical protein
MGRIYDRVCVEWDAFEKEFAPKELHLHRLLELSFFVGAASCLPDEITDDDLNMRIVSVLSLVRWDESEFVKIHGARIW